MLLLLYLVHCFESEIKIKNQASIQYALFVDYLYTFFTFLPTATTKSCINSAEKWSNIG